MSLPSRLFAVALVSASLCACNSIRNTLGGTNGVMPDTEVGLPPSMRGAVKSAPPRTSATVDDDGNPVSTAPNRPLSLPKNAGGSVSSRSADAGPRRINRDEIEGADTGGGSGGGGLAPALTPSGGVGMGGKF